MFPRMEPMDATLPVEPRNNDDRTWAMLAHWSAYAGHFFPFGNIIAPLIIWIVKRDGSPFVEDQARESLNAQISLTIYGFVAGLLIIVLIGIPMLVVLWIAYVVLVLVAALAANKGRLYRYPCILRLVTKN